MERWRAFALVGRIVQIEVKADGELDAAAERSASGKYGSLVPDFRTIAKWRPLRTLFSKHAQLANDFEIEPCCFCLCPFCDPDCIFNLCYSFSN
jgi:hypothetical protein